MPVLLHAPGLPSLTYATAALPALAFLLLYVWRPLKLGFYADDWLVFLHPQPGSFAAWSDLRRLFPSRPGTALVAWWAQLAIGWDAAYAQVVDAVLLTASAIAVATLTYTLAGLLTEQHRARLWGAGLAAAAYLTFPWTLGFSVWTTGAISAAPATCFFCLAACLVVGSRGERLSTQIIAGLLMGASFLTYEAFYGQFISVLALAAVLRSDRPSSWMMLRPALLLGVVNIGCFIYNRIAEGQRKSFSAYWDRTFLDGYFHYLWPNFLSSFREVAPIIVVCLIVVLGIGVLFLARTIGRRRAVLAVMAILAGIYGAGLFYAMAGYPLIMVGPLSRVTVVLSLHAALLLGLLGAASAARQANERWAGAQILASVMLLAAFAAASSYRLADWARSWDLQQEVLRQFPRGGNVSPDLGFLYVGPHGPSDVPLATASWEVPGTIAYAILHESPAAALQIAAVNWSGRRPWFADIPGWSTSFDGETLSQHMCRNPAIAFSAAAKELWVWRVGEPRLERASKGFHIGCDDPGVPN